MSVALSPIINPHQSVLRRTHIRASGLRRCRTVPLPQQRRRQSIAAIQSNNNQIPPTPCKTNYAIRKSAYNGKRTRHRSHYARGTRSRTPSPNKKRKIARVPQTVNKSAERSNTKNDNNQLVQCQYFQNLGLIGVGSFSQVFKVQNAVSKKIYALKKSSSFLNTREAVSDALNEVEIMRMLQKERQEKNNKNYENIWIVKFYDFWISYDRQLHQIYDYYEYGTLLHIVEYNERLNYLQILEILSQICNGLSLIHSLNIVHIDIKPSNLFITGDYILKIGDFGISVNLNNDNIGYNKSLESGDPIYIAPELLTFGRKLTHDINIKTDIFSLGIILLELLCDIKAPSQGQIFQNLRTNIIDFNVMEPSPIKQYKKTKTNNENKKFAFNFSSQNVNVNFEEQNKEIIEEIDNEIKQLCRIMLSNKSHLRPNCGQILDIIRQILNNESYIQHFQTCKPLKSLTLPPETIINNHNNESNNNIYNNNESGGASQCHCNSNQKKETHWFYQESPKCYNQLFHFNPSQSPIININDINDEFQLNLNSAFDNAQNQKSPFLFNNNNAQNQKSPFMFNNKNNNKNIFTFDTTEEKQANNNQNKDQNNPDGEDFRPKNLLFNFM